ncbi:MAG: ACP S-malonyltransferase [Alphaproteobacteria bacterium]
MFMMFPGQGAQFVGMGKIFYDTFSQAREVFQEVDEALSMPLSKLIFEGPEATLSQTEQTQPALMCVSIAMLRTLEQHFNFPLETKVTYMAGHSLGEYTALTAAGVLPLVETARLLKLRGRVMQRAVPEGEGAMAAILSLSMEAIEALVAEVNLEMPGFLCAVANDNCPGQVVISGHKGAVEKAMEKAKEAGAKRCVLLNVSAPFHSSLMAPARDAMVEALQDVSFGVPRVPILSNISARPQTDPGTLREHVMAQVDGRVRWRESLEYLAKEEIEVALEIGPGTVLSGLLRKTCPELKSVAFATPQDMEAFARTYA